MAFIYFILLWTSWGTDVSVQGQLLLSNLLMHICFCAEVNYCRYTSWSTHVIVLRYFYLAFSSEIENRTSSQMCGRLYLPMFLLRVGLLTLMYIASFMALAIFDISFDISIVLCERMFPFALHPQVLAGITSRTPWHDFGNLVLPQSTIYTWLSILLKILVSTLKVTLVFQEHLYQRDLSRESCHTHWAMLCRWTDLHASSIQHHTLIPIFLPVLLCIIQYKCPIYTSPTFLKLFS